MRTIAILLVLLTACGLNTAAQAQPDCKLCRESLQACLKSHSKAACNTEYSICINHCGKNSDRRHSEKFLPRPLEGMIQQAPVGASAVRRHS